MDDRAVGHNFESGTPIKMRRFKCEKISTYDSQTIDAN
jgi:hypothetical protein